MSMFSNSQKRFFSGFTLIEMLVVVTIVSILLLLTLFFSRGQLSKARDARRKADLEKIKISFEHYFSDNGCYPDETILESCSGADLQPYLSAVPCDPYTKQPYLYKPFEGNSCKGYRVYAALESTFDPSIAAVGCDGACGCGYGPEYNYGVSQGVPVSTSECAVDLTATPTPSPSASSGTGGSNGGGVPSPSPSGSPLSVYACDSYGLTCQLYDINSPLLLTCPATFAEQAACDAACLSNPELYACNSGN